MRPLHWAFVEMTRSLHMEQHEFPEVDLVSECGVCCIGGNDLTAQNLAGFCILDLELCGVTKVLKYLTVFVRNCDFHGGISFCFLAFIRIAANLDGRTMLHPLNAVFWGMKPQNNRQSKPKPAVFLMDFASEMLLFLFKNRKNSSLCP